VAHDFNNLLTAILGYAEMLKRSVPHEGTALEDIAEIERAGERARDLTRQLLAFARRQMIEPRVLDLPDLVDAMGRLLARLLGEDVELVSRVDEDVWPVEADASQLEQVVLNLAVNARDAMPGGGRLTLSVRNRVVGPGDEAARSGTTPGDYVEMVIADTGVGMDPGTLAHIFEPFFTTKEAGRGTGLGLATVYGIVKQSGGHIHASSAPGRGSAFQVLLPRSTKPAAASPWPRAEQPAAGAETVLLVEDDAGVRNFAARALRQAGYRVLEAENGPAALDGLLRDTPAIGLLVTDVVMPGMSGPQLAAEVRSRYPLLKVLYITGYAESIVVHHGVAESGIELLPKPFTSNSLLQRVRETLDRL
jgi:CheY-like chemotaxis protein